MSYHHGAHPPPPPPPGSGSVPGVISDSGWTLTFCTRSESAGCCFGREANLEEWLWFFKSLCLRVESKSEVRWWLDSCVVAFTELGGRKKGRKSYSSLEASKADRME